MSEGLSLPLSWHGSGTGLNENTGNDSPRETNPEPKEAFIWLFHSARLFNSFSARIVANPNTRFGPQAIVPLWSDQCPHCANSGQSAFYRMHRGRLDLVLLSPVQERQPRARPPVLLNIRPKMELLESIHVRFTLEGSRCPQVRNGKDQRKHNEPVWKDCTRRLDAGRYINNCVSACTSAGLGRHWSWRRILWRRRLLWRWLWGLWGHLRPAQPLVQPLPLWR